MHVCVKEKEIDALNLEPSLSCMKSAERLWKLDQVLRENKRRVTDLSVPSTINASTAILSSCKSNECVLQSYVCVCTRVCVFVCLSVCLCVVCVFMV